MKKRIMTMLLSLVLIFQTAVPVMATEFQTIQKENIQETSDSIEEKKYVLPEKEASYPLDYLKEQGIYEEQDGLAVMEGEAQATAVNSTKVDLYVLDEYYEEYLTIPSGYKQTFQLSVTDGEKPAYSVIQGKSVTVSSTGLIQPTTTTWYWNGNIGSTVSSGQEGEIVDVDYNYGTSTIKVSTSSTTYYVTVTVHDYATYYAEKVMDSYVAKNITSEMSEYEKMKLVTAFPCNFDYSVEHSGYVGMIVCGGGDCWASTSAILYLCKKVGLTAHIRYAANDAGAGSGHRNVAVKIGDKVYVVDAGYNETAPRYYSIVAENTGFDYYVSDNSAHITQYDGFNSKVSVPSQIDGYTVTSIENRAFFYAEWYSDVNITSITLPSTIKNIEDSAFNSCDSLTTITIPASVTSIGNFVFTACGSLKEIKVQAGNSQYVSRDGVLYNKAMTDLLYYPSGKTGAYTVPSGVKTIHDYSFYWTYNINTLILPKSIESIGEGAFGNSAIKRIYFQGNLPKFSDFAFAYISVQGFYPKANATWNAVGTDTYNAYNLTWNEWSNISNFKAVSAGKNKVRLSWAKLGNVDGYLVYGQKNGEYGYVGMTSGGTVLTDTKALDNDYNFYWVFPYIKDGNGDIVAVPGQCQKYVYAQGICPAVTNLKASALSGGVKLTWSKSTDAEGYLVYGKTASGTYRYIGMASATTYTDKKASKTEYNFYWVYPYYKNSAGEMIVGGKPQYTYGKAL